jgi:hypothetical protein
MAKIVEMMKDIMVTITTENAAALGFPAPSSLLTLTLDTAYRIYSKKNSFKKRDFIESWITDLAAALKPTEIMNNNPQIVILHQKN